MNRYLLPVALVAIVIALVLSGCQRQADTNLNASLTTNRNTAPEPVNTASIEAELNKLEREWAGAVKNRDTETVKRIVADDAIMTYPDGTTGTKSDEVHSVESGAVTLETWDIVETKVTVLDADAAFITGRSTIKKGSAKDPKTGKTIDIAGDYRFIDVYAKRNGKWQAVASQTTKITPQ
ncbi:MAG TPA: nuclear transport factor 2 family protein [Pyrinomonadaceae bacterium]|nr:nuclear transport factor 2 family protein [Pyrinomonadaceae bacterium]